MQRPGRMAITAAVAGLATLTAAAAAVLNLYDALAGCRCGESPIRIDRFDAAGAGSAPGSCGAVTAAGLPPDSLKYRCRKFKAIQPGGLGQMHLGRMYAAMALAAGDTGHWAPVAGASRRWLKQRLQQSRAGPATT